MKLNILDAAISYRSGHHYDYGLKLVRHYVDAGHDVHVYGSADMEDEVAADFQQVCEVTKLFRIFPYSQPEEYDSYAGEIVRGRRESTTIAEDLRSVREADLWIWPTIRAAEVDACARHGVSVSMVGCVYWDPGVESGSLAAQLWRDALLFAQERGLNLTLASVEAELRHRFMPIVPTGKFVVVPHPVDGPPIPEPKTALKRIGFFGHQRVEKGSEIITPLLTHLVRDGYAITFHNSWRQAASPNVPGVDLLEYAEDIAVPIAECDLVVLPYDVQQYRARGSGILMECLALGIPVTAPIGTLPGRIIELSGVGPLFIWGSVRQIYRAIKVTERNYAAYAANAHAGAVRFCSRNGVGRFAEALLAIGGQDTETRMPMQ